ncbi:COBRA-like protein 1 [Acorus calamus]|uniref:COBRA-like protein 1 n=1 Tax=Acorus calamus TaxID=4465 RepID=A0AAV9D7J7_ACOCL|nr:COBRA-like protein 1 [Acorus calamus]
MVTFDIHDWTDDGYLAKVTIQNFYQYRHVEKPGWKVGWIWADHEIIWAISGSLATQQGNCSSFKNRIPHSCRPDPIIVDLMPNTRPDNRSANCCQAGVLSGWAIDGLNSFSSF